MKNIESCLKTITDIGRTTYQNICTGELVTVPWGHVDYILLGIGIFIILFLTFIVLKAIFY